MKIEFFSVLAVLFLSVLLFSCQKDSDTNLPIDSELETQRILDALCNGDSQCVDHVVIKDGNIHLDKCRIIPSKTFINQLDHFEFSNTEAPMISIPNPENPDEMIEIEFKNFVEINEDGELLIEPRHRIEYIWNLTAHRSDVQNIRYYIRPSINNCAGGYENEIVSATNYWNNLTGISVTFTRIYNAGQADLQFGCDTDDYFCNSNERDYLCGISGNASADPMNSFTRKPGQYISINNIGESDLKVGRIIHEIGHTLGLAHTDHNLGPTHHFQGSRSSDSNSIMNSSVSTDFMSFWDKNTVRKIWPDYLFAPTNFNVSRIASGRARLTFYNPGSYTRPYNHVWVLHWYNGNSRWYKMATGQTPPDYNITFSASPGLNYFYVLPSSFNDDVYGGGSGWRGIYLL